MEAGGLFSKRDSADRYAAPFDSARVNAGRWIYIKRPWMRVGGGGAAGRRRSSAPRRRPAGVGRSGITGLVLGCGLVQKNECGMHNPLEPRARVRDGRSRVVSGGGGSAWRGLAGASRPGFSRGLRHTNSSAKVRGEGAETYQGFVVAETAVQGGRRRGRAAAVGRNSRSGRRWAPPGSWVARIDEWWRCEAEREVRKGRGTLVARNCTGGTAYR
jgi:hypothetical protein